MLYITLSVKSNEEQMLYLLPLIKSIDILCKLILRISVDETICVVRSVKSNDETLYRYTIPAVIVRTTGRCCKYILSFSKSND